MHLDDALQNDILQLDRHVEIMGEVLYAARSWNAL